LVTDPRGPLLADPLRESGGTLSSGHLPFRGCDLDRGNGPMLEVIDKGRCTDEHPAPLLFVHGGTLAAWCWDEHFLDFFAHKGFRAVAVSLRGHGASTLSQRLNSCSVADYVDDVRATVDLLGAETVLIGHSMGCLGVQKYLEKYHAPAAVLLAPSTPQGPANHVADDPSSSTSRVACQYHRQLRRPVQHPGLGP
jgi:pimeloyl-ACP methyl ester carboxylesterase